MNTTTRTELTRQLETTLDQFEENLSERELWEIPLEITLDPALSVVITTGGPHIEAVAVVNPHGITRAALHGYWGGETLTTPIQAGSGIWNALETYLQAVA